MRISAKWKMLAFFVMLIIAIVSAGGLNYVLSNIPIAEKPYNTDLAPTQSAKAAAADPVINDDWHYKDKDIEVKIDMVMENDITFYVADVKLSNSSFIKSGFANDKFGRNNKQKTSEIAEANNAIFAVNGDYYGDRNYGIVVRDGIIYRNKPAHDMLAIYRNGDMKIYDEKNADLDQLMKDGLLHSYSFGPGLVVNGNAITNFNKYSIRVKNPRTGVGIIDPLHYIFITVDARQEGYSIGMTLNEFASEFVKRGAKYAYNLDGGGSAAMYFHGRVVNRPCDIGGERKVSDILYIGR